MRTTHTTGREARAYGKWAFGKKLDRVVSTEDGWLYFLLKGRKEAHEPMTWDELDSRWNAMMRDPKIAPKLRKILDSLKKD